MRATLAGRRWGRWRQRRLRADPPPSPYPSLFFQKPVGFVRTLSFAGTAAAAGVLIYFWAQGNKREAGRRAG
jgi:hypothetical protein